MGYHFSLAFAGNCQLLRLLCGWPAFFHFSYAGLAMCHDQRDFKDEMYRCAKVIILHRGLSFQRFNGFPWMCYFHSPVSTGQSWSQAGHCWLLAPSCYFGSDRCMFTGPLGWFRLLTTWWEFLRPCLFPRGFSVPCMIESDWHLDIRTGGRHLSSLVACQVWNFSLCSAANAMSKVVVFGWIVSLVAPGLFKCQTLRARQIL